MGRGCIKSDRQGNELDSSGRQGKKPREPITMHMGHHPMHPPQNDKVKDPANVNTNPEFIAKKEE